MKRLLIAALVFTATGAYAQTAALEPIVVTANRYDLESAKAPSYVTVIGQQQISASGAQTVDELLKGLSGVHVTDNSTAKTAVVDIRGYGDTAARNVLVLVNNRKINPVDISGTDWLQIPLSSVERVEVMRGAGSVLYGDNAVGGVVNIITKKGQEGFHGEVGTKYGSYRTQSRDAQLSGKQARVDYLFSARQFDTDGYRVNSHLRANDFNGRLGYQLSDYVNLDLNTTWHEDDYGLPGGLTDNNLALLGRRGSANRQDFAKTRDRMLQLSADLNPWQDADMGRFVVDTSYRNRDSYAVFYSFGEFATKRNIDSYGINSKYILERDIAGRYFKGVTGVDYYTNDNAILGSGSNSDNIVVSKNEVGLYAQGEYYLTEKLSVNTGTRYQRADYTFNQNNAGSPVYIEQAPDKHIGSAGLKYDYAPGSNIFANAQQTFRFLATDEWYDSFSGLSTNLNQQKGVQYQAGIKHDFNGKAAASLTPYWVDNSNEIFYDPAGGGGFGANNNYDKTRRIGVEAGQVVHLKPILGIASLDRLDLKADYTYQNATFTDGMYKGNRIPMTSRHQGSIGVNVGFMKHYDWSLLGRLVGDQFAINDTANATDESPAYGVLDTKLTFSHEHIEIFGGINNLLGEKYDMYATKSVSSAVKSHFPAPERSFMVGAKVKF